MKPLLTADGLYLSYKLRKGFGVSETKMVLRDLSFQVMSGGCLGIIGRNGAGKSSLLKILAGIIDPDRGKVESTVNKITLLSLQAGFNPELSGRFNAVLNGMLMGFTHAEMLDRLPEIIEFSELGAMIDQPVKTYSAGMRVRLGFSTAIQLQPEILLIDEVLSVGDVEFQKKSMAAMRNKILSEQTVVMVSHIGRAIKELCNQALWIEDGVTQMVGAADEVVDAYEKYIIENPAGTK